MVETSDTKQFILVHGFGHGAWCWYKLVAMLKSKGHKVSALNLGLNTKQTACLSDYLQPLMEFMAALDEDEEVVLVGHSYGGIHISLAMESFTEKISTAVFITAYMPNCNDQPAILVKEFFRRGSTKSLIDTMFTFDQGLENLPSSAAFGPNYLAAKVYQYCSLEGIEKKSLLSNERYGKIRRCYVVCEEDEWMKNSRSITLKIARPTKWSLLRNLDIWPCYQKLKSSALVCLN